MIDSIKNEGVKQEKKKEQMLQLWAEAEVKKRSRNTASAGRITGLALFHSPSKWVTERAISPIDISTKWVCQNFHRRYCRYIYSAPLVFAVKLNITVAMRHIQYLT